MVDKRAEDECWLWTGSRDGKGYGQINEGGNGGRPRRAHRVIYEAVMGAIPPGLHIDHLCRNRVCVNPAHLEPVTGRENQVRGYLARGYVCLHGAHSKSVCKECRNAYMRAWNAKRRRRVA